MGDKKTKLCKHPSKSIDKDFNGYCQRICNPKFICIKCGRAANKKSDICKPEVIK